MLYFDTIPSVIYDLTYDVYYNASAQLYWYEQVDIALDRSARILTAETLWVIQRVRVKFSSPYRCDPRIKGSLRLA